MNEKIIEGSFPATRLRRLRRTSWTRQLVSENSLSVNNLVQALIVHDGSGASIISTMPGITRLTPPEAAKAALRASRLGIPAIALFPYIEPEKKDAIGSEADNPDGLLPAVIEAVKNAAPDIGIICDVALDPYTDHGHDGVIDANGYVLNDKTNERLIAQGLMLAKAGADILAPSDMMDGRIGALRSALEAAGHNDMIILSYAAKYASTLYNPFRQAIGTKSVLQGDKNSYQMAIGNGDEAMREIALDIAEGADMVMVKPGMICLDIIARASSMFNIPVLAFQVSGEYAQIEAASALGMFDGKEMILESFMAFRRAGARAIISYFAERAATIMTEASNNRPRHR